MKVILLLFVAICCIAAVKANSSYTKVNNDIKNVIDTTETKRYEKDADLIEAENECKINEKESKLKEKEKQRIEKEREEKERKEKEREEKERKEKERKEKEREEKERKEKERKEKEREEKERKEKEREEKERKEKERKEKEREEKERKEKERKEKEREEKEKQRKEKERNEKECRSDHKESDNKNHNENRDGKGNAHYKKEHHNDSKGSKGNKNWWDHKRPCGKPSKPSCNTICPMIANPICASPDGFKGDSKTFENDCLLNVYNCQNPKAKYRKTCDGACEPQSPNCPQVCPYYVEPFCALADGWCAEPRTFSNPCFLEIYNCENPNNKYEFFHDGECIQQTTPAPDCGLIDCPQDIQPFCGLPKDSCGQPRIFNNKCYLEVYNCFNPDQQYEFFHDGECLTTSTTSTPSPQCTESVCPNDDKPICALPDGFCGKPKTFANECYMKVYNTFNPKEQYKYFHDKACFNEPTTLCDSIMCTKEYFPLCAYPVEFCGEIRTFGNTCQLDEYNCRNPGMNYRYFHDGECLTTSTTSTTSTPSPQCTEAVCPNDDKPICALPDGFCGKPKTFANECYMKVYNAFNPKEQYKYFHDKACFNEPTTTCDSIMCTKEYFPLCAYPVEFCGEIRTFGNTCQLDEYNCRNPGMNYRYFHDGECLITSTTSTPSPQCTEAVCPNDDKPICALPDGFCGKPKTFANECSMKVYNAFNPKEQYKYFHDKACFNEPTTTCDSIMCTKEYFPLCAYPVEFCGEIRTFGNTCQLDEYNCQNPGMNYRYFHDGECLTTPEPEPNCAAISCSNEGPAVCGLPDGFCGPPQTFTNGCNLKVYNCFNPNEQYKYFHDGDCLTTPEPEPNCAAISCSNEGPAVCGLPDGFCGPPQTFTNGCNLKVYNCFNPTEQYKKFHDGKCLSDEPEPECPTNCPYIYNPICATGMSGNVRTFSNECDLQSYNCQNQNNQFTFDREGECDECADIKCNKIGQLICAENSEKKLQTFGNPCQLQQYNCDNCNDKYEYLYEGSCIDPVICTEEYIPVCAISATLGPKTFSNKCKRDAYISLHPEDAYVAAYDGECKKTCKLACPKILAPVCGLDSYGNERKFNNMCLYELHNCLNENDQCTLAYEAKCNNCSYGCIEIYSPVCTMSEEKEKQFSNQCELDRYNCINQNNQLHQIYDGECHNCGFGCPDNYDPICTQDASGNEKQFSNKCELDSYNCRYPFIFYTQKYSGVCNNCKVACTRDYRPRCTRDSSGNEKQFNNQCEMDSYNCRYPDDQCTIAYEAECNNCSEGCIEIYSPVCTMSEGKEKQFSNQCELDRYNCINKYNQLHQIYDGECHNCGFGCPDNYDPICTQDESGNEKQFFNKCELDSYNCRYPFNFYTEKYSGVCNNCKVACTRDYRPRCTQDSSGNEKQFSNQCEMDSYNCRYPDDQCTIAYEAECNNCGNLLLCTKIYAPVCANDSDGEEKQFGNQCELDRYNCLHKNNPLETKYQGECHNCPTMCPAVYKPVCSKDIAGNDKQFSNQCELGSYNCRYPYSPYTIQYQGECKKTSCIKPCPKIMKRICAKDTNGNTKAFNSECELDNYNCENPGSKYIKSNDGECKPVCQDICTAIRKPVCASPNGDCNHSDAKTFSTQCALDSYNCHNPKKVLIKATDGECPVNCKTLKCTKELKWVCATPSDPKGKPTSFSNDCQRLLHNCNNPKNKYDYSYDGQCEDLC